MPKVTVYSTPTCPWCHKAKDWLKEHKVEYEDKDVSADEEARKELVEKSGQMGVPVIVVEGNEPIVGFDIDALNKALDIKE
ncbi:MAG: glutaredoxin domain-containing protein [Nanoarchaeota archaeon]